MKGFWYSRKKAALISRSRINDVAKHPVPSPAYRSEVIKGPF
jgi:hypothetical protein